jgi:Mrp family chromosome partitioning ATPase
MIRKCSRQCDYVIIDAPAGGLVAEPALIAGCSDGWIYVVREDYAHTETIQEGRETMEGAGCELMGLVLTA